MCRMFILLWPIMYTILKPQQPNSIGWVSINHRRFYLIALSLHLWDHRLQNPRILFFTDNEAPCTVIGKKSCCDKSLIVLSFVQCRLVLVCSCNIIYFKLSTFPTCTINSLIIHLSLAIADLQRTGTSLHKCTSHRDASSTAVISFLSRYPLLLQWCLERDLVTLMFVAFLFLPSYFTTGFHKQ